MHIGLKAALAVGVVGAAALTLAACGRQAPPAYTDWSASDGGDDELTTFQQARASLDAWNAANKEWPNVTPLYSDDVTTIARAAADNGRSGADAVAVLHHVHAFNQSQKQWPNETPLDRQDLVDVTVDAMERDLTTPQVMRSLTREPLAYVEYARTH